MKRTIATICLLFCSLITFAQEYTFNSNDLSLVVNAKGYISDLDLYGQSITQPNTYPLIVGCVDGHLTFPMSFSPTNDSLYRVGLEDGGHILLKIENHFSYLKASIVEQEEYDALLFCPVLVTLNESVGEIVGIARDQVQFFGMHSLNAKTDAGLPSDYGKIIQQYFDYQGKATHAAVKLKTGTWMQFSATDRRKMRLKTVEGVDNVMVMPIKGEDAQMEGTAWAIFGGMVGEELGYLKAIEQNEALPHLTHDNQWDKINTASTRSYFVNSFDKKDATFVQEKCRQAGLYHGLEVLANRIPTNDKMVGPKPSEHLLRQGTLNLLLPLDDTQTEFGVYYSDLFNLPASINALQIGDEIISYLSTEPTKHSHVFYKCTRGAYGTKKTAHERNATVYKLWGTPQHTFLPDLETQDQMVRKEAKKCANTDTPLLVFNDLKSYAYNGHGDLALCRFLQAMNENNPEKLLQTDLLTHLTWHYLARVNENELWNESMRMKIEETLPDKHDFYQRNLCPWMIGNFRIHSAYKNSNATTIEELEWFLSKAAAYDAGFGLDFEVETMRKHGQTDAMLNAINVWETLRLSGAFSEEQKEAFKDPYGSWHIEKGEGTTYYLYPQHISRRYFYSSNDLSWSWNSPYSGRYALCIAVEGKGSISELNLRTPNGSLYLPCTVKAGQFLFFDFDGSAYITDANYNKISDINAQGVAVLDEGTSEVSFHCEVKSEEKKTPQVSVKYLTRGTPISISLK